MQLTVREATPEDAPAIAALLRALMVYYEIALLPNERLIRIVEHVMRLPLAWYLVAEVDGEVVGALQLNERYSTWSGAPFGYVEDFCVAEGWRSRGVGAALLAHAEGWGRRLGWSRVALDVLATNGDAVRFYERQGFENTGNVIYKRQLLPE